MGGGTSSSPAARIESSSSRVIRAWPPAPSKGAAVRAARASHFVGNCGGQPHPLRSGERDPGATAASCASSVRGRSRAAGQEALRRSPRAGRSRRRRAPSRESTRRTRPCRDASRRGRPTRANARRARAAMARRAGMARPAHRAARSRRRRTRCTLRTPAPRRSRPHPDRRRRPTDTGSGMRPTPPRGDHRRGPGRREGTARACSGRVAQQESGPPGASRPAPGQPRTGTLQARRRPPARTRRPARSSRGTRESSDPTRTNRCARC